MGKIKTQISDLSTKLTLRAISSSGAYNAWDSFASSYGLLPRDIASQRNQAPTSLLLSGLFVLQGNCGERMESVRGTMGRGKREERPPSPALSIFFDYCYFFWDTQWEPLRERDLQPLPLCKTCSLSTFKNQAVRGETYIIAVILYSSNLLHTHVSVGSLGSAMGTGSTNH